MLYFTAILAIAKVSKGLNDLQDVPKLSDRTKQELDRVIDLDEIEQTVKSLKSNKCPSTDRLVSEYYQVFWEDIKIILYNVYHEEIQNEIFHLSARRGIISLMEKVSRDSVVIRNWRPLILMNVDHKIFAKLLATRLQTVLEELIHQDQTGFKKGRYIGENLLELLSIKDYCNIHDIEGIIVSFDFEQAFDRVEWNILNYVLEFFNFGPNIRKWIKLLQTGMESSVLNNGYTSCWFKISRSLRQG